MRLSGYIPCCNNAQHIGAAIESLQRQTLPIEDIMVIDDGSTDGSLEIARRLGVRVISHAKTLGRGAVNARGVSEARHEHIVILGATNVVPPDFTLRAIKWFEERAVAAVCARIVPPRPKTTTDRWRARHLFLVNHPAEFRHGHHFASTGSMLRRSAALAVGNFDARLTHSEDGELGWRLAASSYDILFDPDLHVIPCWSNPLWKVLERHWRWYAGVDEAFSLKGYWKAIGYSIKVMAAEDLRERDLVSAMISLFTPHHHFAWTAVRALRRTRGERVTIRGSA